MNVDYIVVQAGGKGTRLGHLTRNKPKALVSVNNLPMLFHLFTKYPDKKFIIIGDYQIDVLRKYLEAFAKVQYLVVDARGTKGTCAGLQASMKLIPSGNPFLLIWSDIILPMDFCAPLACKNYVGLSKDFECRWRYKDACFEEIPSTNHGVAGFFLFEDKHPLEAVPESGEFVRWLQAQNIAFDTVDLHKTMEFGLLERCEDAETASAHLNVVSVSEFDEYDALDKPSCRPFNKITRVGDRMLKIGIDKQGRELAVRERAWYKAVQSMGFQAIPKIFSYNPLEMEWIDGGNVFAVDLTMDQKQAVLRKIVASLQSLHQLGAVETDFFSLKDAYLSKTFKRLGSIRDMLPFADRPMICINGKSCRNVYFHRQELERRFEQYSPPAFHLLHGDCTFSNILLNQQLDPIFIDPRGYFGHVELYGDPAYDWAKLYYSIAGNYDQFNRKNFSLEITDEEVTLAVESNGWETLANTFFDLVGDEVSRRDIQLIHAIIWLSLTTYAWDDYDSICGAFYNGLYYLEEAWRDD